MSEAMKLMKVMAGGDFFILAARVELSFPAVNQLFFNLNETKVTQNSKAAKIFLEVFNSWSVGGRSDVSK